MAESHLSMEEIRASHANLYRDKDGQDELCWERLWQTSNAEYGRFAGRPTGPPNNAFDDKNNAAFQRNNWQTTSDEYGTNCSIGCISANQNLDDSSQACGYSDNACAGQKSVTFATEKYSSSTSCTNYDELKRIQQQRLARQRDPYFNPAQKYVEECCGRMWNSLHGV